MLDSKNVFPNDQNFYNSYGLYSRLFFNTEKSNDQLNECIDIIELYQLTNGEIPLFCSHDIKMKEVKYRKTVFLTAIQAALHLNIKDARLQQITNRSIDFLKREASKMRLGRVNPAMVEDIEVEAFDQKMSLKELAAIKLEGPREIIIDPWDDSYLEAIEKALVKADLGTSPNVTGETIRLSFPSLSEERKENLEKELSDKKENARQTVRKWRDEAWKEIQEMEREGEISEDDKYRAKDELQDLVDEYNDKIDEVVEQKKKQIEEE